MFPYIPNTPKDEESMLNAIGANSINEMFSDIPKDLLLNRRLNLSKPLSEIEVRKNLRQLSNKNMNTEDLVCFLGAGSYDHYIPAVVNHLMSRSEFYSAYTPYQPEISQGTLQVIFEFQTMISNLTGMDVVNASMYDVATGCAEAAMMAMESTKRKNIVVSKTVSPETRKVLNTYMRFHGGTVTEIDFQHGVTDIQKLKNSVDNSTAAVIVQNPNFFGIVEDVSEVEKIAHSNKSLLVMSVDPISLGILKTPGEIGADIVIGDGQSLGNSLNFGGPYLGFFATTKKLMRKMPGRIVGQTNDIDGKRAFVLTLQSREQHIRRQKATSNICTSQALNVLAATIYLITMGKEGIKEVAMQCTSKAHYTFNVLTKSGKYVSLFNKPFFMEFGLKSQKDCAFINSTLLKEGILGGYCLEKDYPELSHSVLLCVTEKRTKNEMDKLISVMEGIK